MNEDDRESVDWLREVFEKQPPAPRDVVPAEGLTRDDLLRMNEAVGTAATGTIPGKVIVDVDGLPIGVEESRTETTVFGGAVVTSADLERNGLTADDVPHLTVMDPPRKEQK